MTDWKALQHAYGPATDIPEILAALSPDPRAEAVIWSLVRKPGAFARYRYREELFPSLVFRRAYDALRDARGDAPTSSTCASCTWWPARCQARVEEVLEDLLGRGDRPDFAAVKALAAPDKPAIPEVHIRPPDLEVYDRLLVGGA